MLIITDNGHDELKTIAHNGSVRLDPIKGAITYRYHNFPSIEDVVISLTDKESFLLSCSNLIGHRTSITSDVLVERFNKEPSFSLEFYGIQCVHVQWKKKKGIFELQLVKNIGDGVVVPCSNKPFLLKIDFKALVHIQ